jgi:hypothetical protein
MDIEDKIVTAVVATDLRILVDFGIVTKAITED